MQVYIGLEAAFGKLSPSNGFGIFGLVALLLVVEDELCLFLQIGGKLLVFSVAISHWSSSFSCHSRTSSNVVPYT